VNKPKDERNKRKTGAKPERLKLRGDWEALVGKALQKKRPKKGWPKPEGGK
jgi:hypothetical protein